MNRKRSAVTEENEKEENAVIRILQSSTCRRLFSWGGADDTIPTELSKEAREEQKLRWNFDFQTETPLPGRYQWVRTGEANGTRRNGSGEPERKRPCDDDDDDKNNKRSRSPSQSQSPRPEKRRAEGSTGSCDRALNESQDSLHLNDASSYGVDCT